MIAIQIPSASVTTIASSLLHPTLAKNGDIIGKKKSDECGHIALSAKFDPRNNHAPSLGRAVVIESGSGGALGDVIRGDH
jgi:hypothetical protein